MQKSLYNPEDASVLAAVTCLIGSPAVISDMSSLSARTPFDEPVLEFLNSISKTLMSSREAKLYPDVVTFGFWLRKASMLRIKEKFGKQDGDIHLGRGIAFHIAPSNVPVNYAYSLVAGLLLGNANIVRVPSKDFPQVNIINSAIKKAMETHEHIRPYIALLRYGRDQNVNDLLSEICDVRIIWGGDATIAEIRKSPLAPRAGEITFADRYSLAVVDSDVYMEIADKRRVAEEFYNDTYLTDQNACTSPRIVAWTGSQISSAKIVFWNELHELVKQKYIFQPIQGVNKLTSSYLTAALGFNIIIEPHEDNLLVRVRVPKADAQLMELKGDSGYFFEYDCKSTAELFDLCDDKRCQTIGYIGEVEIFKELLEKSPKGIDRIVPIGKTMDFELIWDGYDLTERMTRTIRIV